jgi:hypothetical protein
VRNARKRRKQTRSKTEDALFLRKKIVSTKLEHVLTPKERFSKKKAFILLERLSPLLRRIPKSKFPIKTRRDLRWFTKISKKSPKQSKN